MPWEAVRKRVFSDKDVTLPVRLTFASVQDLALAERWYLDEAPHVLPSFDGGD